MHILNKIVTVISTLLVGVLTVFWNLLISIIHFIDGGESEDSYASDDNTVWYNYRTEETDPIKRTDGLYNDKL